jgi:CubicO group peptidase (beta-lactamase class C family)
MKIRYIILPIFIACVTGSAAQKPTMASSRIDQFLDNAEKNLGFHGTVLLIQGRDTLLYKGYGFSDRKKKIPTKKNIAYNIASITKGFTATAILKLVEEGKLLLQDPLTKYFDNVPEHKTNITLHHLLTHTSGIGEHYAADGESDREKAIQKILNLPLTDSVGKRFIYCNDGYSLLGIITELVTGETWESYIKRFILTPLAMNETFFQNEYSKVDNARVPKLNGRRPGTYKRDYGMIGATGLFSTAIDLARFQEALSTNLILRSRSKELLFGKYRKIKTLGADTNSYYCYGLFVTEGEAHHIERIWLRGLEDSWGTAQTNWIPQTKTSLIVLSNSVSLSNGEKPHIYISNEIIKNLLK